MEEAEKGQGMDKPRYKRRKYIIDRDNQFRFIARFIALSLAGNIAAVTAFVLLARPRLDTLIYSMRMPDMPVSSLIMQEIVFTSIGVTLITVVLFAVTAHRLLHRLNGPLINIQGKLARAAQGDLTARVVLRKTDSFQDLAKEINTLLDQLHGDVRTLKELTRETKMALQSQMSSPAADSGKEQKEVAAGLAKMREVVARYRK